MFSNHLTKCIQQRLINNSKSNSLNLLISSTFTIRLMFNLAIYLLINQSGYHLFRNYNFISLACRSKSFSNMNILYISQFKGLRNDVTTQKSCYFHHTLDWPCHWWHSFIAWFKSTSILKLVFLQLLLVICCYLINDSLFRGYLFVIRLIPAEKPFSSFCLTNFLSSQNGKNA